MERIWWGPYLCPQCGRGPCSWDKWWVSPSDGEVYCPRCGHTAEPYREAEVAVVRELHRDATHCVEIGMWPVEIGGEA